MSIRVKYNHTLKFRRRTAFLRMYRAKNPRRLLLMEMILLGVGALTAVVVRFGFAKSTSRFAVYAFFFAVLIALYFLARLLRAGVMVLRVRRAPREEWDKEYLFDERGFAFGPVDAQGKMIETRWRDVDRVYFMEGAVYILLMGRRHWAAVDPSLMIDGTPEDLKTLVRRNLPTRQIVG